MEAYCDWMAGLASGAGLSSKHWQVLAADPNDRIGHDPAARLDVANGRFEAILSLAVVLIDRPQLARKSHPMMRCIR